MADFERAFDKVVSHEGGYVNDPDDKGGETYMGICRKNYPKLKMWEVIDTYKNAKWTVKQINAGLGIREDVKKEVEEIYKNKYWDVLKLDNIKSQKIAVQLFDDAINRGPTAAVKLVATLYGKSTAGKMTDELIDLLNNRK